MGSRLDLGPVCLIACLGERNIPSLIMQAGKQAGSTQAVEFVIDSNLVSSLHYFPHMPPSIGAQNPLACKLTNIVSHILRLCHHTNYSQRFLGRKTNKITVILMACIL